jgi:CRP/FNR family cyclic AMP-dependent transcriptional regulator
MYAGAAVESILRAAPLFHRLNASDSEALSREFTAQRVVRGEIIFEEGQTGDNVYVVLSGLVKLGCHGDDGRQVLVDLIGPAGEFGELSVFDPGPRATTATAARRGQLAFIPGAVLAEWAGGHPQMALQLLGVLARRLRRTNNFVGDYVLTDAKVRIAKQLLDLARRFGTVERSRLYVRHGLTQDELAQLVGISRETLNRVLANFAARGWLYLDGRTIVISNSERIVRLARQ